MKWPYIFTFFMFVCAPCAMTSAQEPAPGENSAPSVPESDTKKSEADLKNPESKAGSSPEVKSGTDEKTNNAKGTDKEAPAGESPQSDSEANKPTAQKPASLPAEIVPRDYLVLPAVGSYGKAAIHLDPIDAQISNGKWKMPSDGDEVEVRGGVSRQWNEKRASEKGELDASGIRGGYAVTEFDSPEERVMILRATGHAFVYVNGEPRTGDIYEYGWVELPVLIKKGRNELLFQAFAPTLEVKLTEPKSSVFFLSDDATLPDVVEGETDEKWAAIPVVNATQENFTGHLSVKMGDSTPVESPLPKMPPLSLFKAPVKLPSIMATPGEKVIVDVAIHPGLVPEEPEVTREDAPAATPDTLAKAQLTLESVAAGKLQSRTFRSNIDGSVQSYAVQPAGGDDPTWEGPPGIVLALHGTGVDAHTFASAYTPKRWAHIIAPTNRRPQGFDWEDWGRIDAFEALADAEQRFPNDPLRRYVTGHSMGGHGAWHLGVSFPDKFAAIGPSGGWPSYWAYGGGMPDYDEPTSIEEMLMRGNSPSDTISLIKNLTPVGTYILHGEKDSERDVSVVQARFMRSQLAEFHPDFAYYEKPDAGHWWGNETVDWPRMMQFFRNRNLPITGVPASIDFTTANPAISSRCHWAAIETQLKQLRPSRIVLNQTPTERRITGRTDNVDRLMLDLSHFPPGRTVRVQLDGTRSTRVTLPSGDEKKVWLVNRDDRWRQVPVPAQRVKGPHRNGTFKAVFEDRVMLVYGTKGSEEENRWSYAKARFDAETFWYRGNGAIEVIADTDFNPEHDRDASVILYGNSETNGAWPALLSICPVQVRPGLISIDQRPEVGDDLGILFCWPRQGSDNALVGVVGGTGIDGMRLTTRLRYFVAGVAYPDLLLFGPETLTEGSEDIRAVGYFGNDWKVNSGEIVWRDLAL